MLRLKVAGISSLTDARYCAGMGVEFLSIVFDDSGKGSLSPEAFAGIRPWIEGVSWLGEYSGSDIEMLQSLASEYQLDTWICSSIPSDSDFNIESKIIRNTADFDEVAKSTLSFQLEGSISASDARFQKLKELSPVSAIFLAEPLPAEDAIQLHQEIPNLVFSLRSSGEERPGWMDLGTLQDYLEAVEDYLRD